MAFGVTSIGSNSQLLGQSQTNSTGSASSLNFPSNLNLTSQQQSELQQILQQAQSGALTPQQVQSQISSVLTPQQLQTLQSDLRAAGGHHHHHHGGSGSASGTAQSQTLTSTLNLTSSQQSQIASIIQSAQTNGSSPSTVLSEIDNVLTPSQQQQFQQLLSSTYTSTGTVATGSPPSIFSSTA